MGPWGGFITGLAESIEYIMTPAVIVFFIGSYLTGIFETPAAYQPLWWIGCYLVFVLLNYGGVALSFKISVVVTVLALAVLVVFWISAIPHADFTRWALNIAAGPDGKPMELAQGGGSFLPFGWHGVLAALPFAVWLFLAIEELPLAAEESVDPKKDMPKGLIFGMFTLIFSALMIMLLNASIGSADEGKLHGAYSLATSAEPLLDGFRVIYGGDVAKLLALLAVIGLIASFHTIIFAFGRQIYSLSRAGYYPAAMSLTHGSRKTPHIALVHRCGHRPGGDHRGVVLARRGEGGAMIGATLLNMAVFGAMISYAFQGVSFILLRKNMPNIERPYRSPLGIPGAAATVVIAAGHVVLPAAGSGVSRRRVRRRWPGMSPAFCISPLIGRHKLVLSPEEEFAVTGGQHGHPESEGYGTTKITA